MKSSVIVGALVWLWMLVYPYHSFFIYNTMRIKAKNINYRVYVPFHDDRYRMSDRYMTFRAFKGPVMKNTYKYSTDLSLQSTIVNDQDTIANTSKSIRAKIDREMFNVAVPAFIALAADPLASIVDAMYVGRLGVAEQAGMGIATNAQYSVAKLYNDPLLKTSTSLVAGKTGEELSANVATALSSAILIGILQSAVFLFFSMPIMSVMGVSSNSNMLKPALTYLRWRALGIPATTVLLVSNSIFRGRGDTKTPLIWTIIGNIANIVIDPILIFGMNMGCGGAGAATAISQWITAIPLLYFLNKAIPFNIFKKRNKFLSSALKSYYKAGGLVLLRTIGKIAAYTVTASAAARLGTVAMAAYSLTFNLGFATTQLCESVSIATQALLARDMPLDNKRKRFIASHVIQRSIVMGLVISMSLTLTMKMSQSNIIGKLTKSPEVFRAAYDVMPVVLLTQILKGLVYSTGGILLGGLDWGWSTASVLASSAVCIGLVVVLPKSLWSIWVSLAAFMGTQVIIAAIRFMSGRGPWKDLHIISDAESAKTNA